MQGNPSRKFIAMMTAMMSTPPAKRRRLERIDSDEKENRPHLANVQDSENRAPSNQGEPPRKRPLGQRQQGQADARAFPSEYPLIGREKECEQLDKFMVRCLEGGERRGGCTYVSGGPGTGKTCSARAAAAARQRLRPDTRIIEVNCMELPQRTAAGLFRRLEQAASGAASVLRSHLGGTADAAAKALARLSGEVIVIVDEVDQLTGSTPGRRASGARSLESLCSLPFLAGAPAVALIAIANQVNLFPKMEEGLQGLVEPLLFEPYSANQLRSIALARLTPGAPAPEVGAAATGSATASVPGKLNLSMEVRLRQVAKSSGDCRQVMHLCEGALLEARVAQDEAAERGENPAAAVEPKSNPATVMKDLARFTMDPLASVMSLPLEQQVLLCALCSAQREAVRIPEVCTRYKALCQRLHQPVHLAKEQVKQALVALEQRGLLTLRRAGRGRGVSAARGDEVVELAAARDKVQERIFQANKSLERLLQ